MEQTIPEVLYKYRSFNDSSLSALINRELFFATPSMFNDPFDSQLTLYTTEYFLEEYLDIVKRLEELKFFPVGTYITEVNRYENPATRPELLDKILPGLEDNRAKLSVILNNYGIFSLSETENEILLWSHYADNHRGFCIGFNGECFGSRRGAPIIKVDYQAEIPKLSPLTLPFKALEKILIENDCIADYEAVNKFIEIQKVVNTGRNSELVKLALKTKYIYWQYEKEWRIIRGPGAAVVPFTNRCITSISYGLRMLPEHKKTIRNLLSGTEWSDVVFKQAVRNPTNFSIDLITVEEEHYEKVMV